MILFAIFLAILATLGAQQRVNPRLNKTTGKPNWQTGRSGTVPNAVDTVIENKNVNIIVNVDPKDVAKELWSLIETRLEDRTTTRKSMPRNSALEELEKIVRPIIVTPSRRSNPPSAFEIAYALDHVTRRALLGADSSRVPTIDDEIDTREIVARMMLKLKLMMERDKANSASTVPTMHFIKSRPNYRRSMKNEDGNDKSEYTTNSDEVQQEVEDEEQDTAPRGDDLVKIVLNLRKSAILQGNIVLSDTDP